MPTFHFKQTTTATPEQFVAGLTDFGPGRAELFGNSTDEYLKVHDQGPEHADVTEGSRGTWERLDYDWSDPDRVVMTTTDSNAWGGQSGHTYTFTRNADGTPTSTPSWCARARTSGGGSSGSCSAPSAGELWRRNSGRRSRRSRPGMGTKRMGTKHEY